MASLDWSVLAAYALVLWAIARGTARAEAGARDWQLAGRSLPGWAVLLSLLATELSAATFIGVPHAAYTGDWSYLQLAFGALCAKLVLASTFIPLYHRRGVVTVYGFVEERFGRAASRASALAFVLGRLLASGVRLYIAALAFSVATGLDIRATIVLSGAAAGLYTSWGGIRTVVWTDVLQGAVLFTAAAVSLWLLVGQIPNGWSGLLGWSEWPARTRVFVLPEGTAAGVGLLEQVLANGRVYWVAFLGGFWLTLATHATDHDMVQRLLATRGSRSSSWALRFSGLLNFPVTMLFLALGTALALFYAEGAPYDISDDKRIFALFAVHELPSGVRGLLFAGLFAAAMSSLDSAICAVTTTLEEHLLPKRPTGEGVLRRTRWISAAVCAALVLSAGSIESYASRVVGGGTNLVEFALAAMTIVYGGLLGIFLLGFLSRGRGSPGSVCTGLAVGASLGLLLFLQEGLLGSTPIAWPWWTPLAAGAAALVAALRPSRRGA